MGSRLAITHGSYLQGLPNTTAGAALDNVKWHPVPRFPQYPNAPTKTEAKIPGGILQALERFCLHKTSSNQIGDVFDNRERGQQSGRLVKSSEFVNPRPSRRSIRARL